MDERTQTKVVVCPLFSLIICTIYNKVYNVWKSICEFLVCPQAVGS